MVLYLIPEAIVYELKAFFPSKKGLLLNPIPSSPLSLEKKKKKEKVQCRPIEAIIRPDGIIEAAFRPDWKEPAPPEISLEK